jgi:hypothetical protein
VMDTKGSSLGHLTRISIASLKKYYMYIQVWNSKYLARVPLTPFALMVKVLTNSKIEAYAGPCYQRQNYNNNFHIPLNAQGRAVA